MKKVYAIVQHYGHQETILCYVSSKKKLAKKIKELVHNSKNIGFFDDKIKNCNNYTSKSSEEINEKNIFDYRYVEWSSCYSYTAYAIEVF